MSTSDERCIYAFHELWKSQQNSPGRSMKCSDSRKYMFFNRQGKCIPLFVGSKPVNFRWSWMRCLLRGWLCYITSIINTNQPLLSFCLQAKALIMQAIYLRKNVTHFSMGPHWGLTGWGMVGLVGCTFERAIFVEQDICIYPIVKWFWKECLKPKNHTPHTLLDKNLETSITRSQFHYFNK